MKKYIGACVLFILNNEVISILALLIIMVFAATDLGKEIIRHAEHS